MIVPERNCDLVHDVELFLPEVFLGLQVLIYHFEELQKVSKELALQEALQLLSGEARLVLNWLRLLRLHALLKTHVDAQKVKNLSVRVEVSLFFEEHKYIVQILDVDEFFRHLSQLQLKLLPAVARSQVKK